jgi:hypothetical protein
MVESRGFRNYGLYYPYFHIRDERWLKVAALYWPKIIRVVPDGYPTTNDTETARVLIGELGFIERQSPGSSVQAVAQCFLELLSNPDPRLTRKFCLRGVENLSGPMLLQAATGRGTGGSPERLLAAVRTNQIDPQLASALIERRWAVQAYSRSDIALALAHPPDKRGYEPDGPGWLAMDERLVTVYTSVLAEDVAIANQLQPTTDQVLSYAVASQWKASGIAAALLDEPGSRPVAASTGGLAEALGFLALNLVIPDRIDDVPASKIVEVRQRYGSEFRAFGLAVDQAASELSDLAGIRDRSILDRYLKDEVAARFSDPMDELARQLRSLGLDAATLAVNVKTELPAAVGFVGAAAVTGHPLIAGTSAAALGILGIRRGVRQRREAIRQTLPSASFLLHARGEMTTQGLLTRTLRQVARITGTY